MGALGVYRVSGDDRADEVNGVRQGLELGDLVGLASRLALGQHYVIDMVRSHLQQRPGSVVALPESRCRCLSTENNRLV